MTPNHFIKEIKKRNPALFWFGWINVLMLVVTVLMSVVDTTLIMGINAWIKPMKFAISVTIYTWTFAWLLHYLPDPVRKTFISWGIIICMTVENTLIFMQAFRGTTSHFNIRSAFDAIVFSTMGFFILLNTFLVLYTIILFFSKKISLESPFLLAWRLGLIFFFLGAISGGVMSVQLSHTIGMADGGPGIPFLNWSTVAGDVRSAHFITLHGLQFIPLSALVFHKLSKENAGKLVGFFALFYGVVCVWLHGLAFNGLPV